MKARHVSIMPAISALTLFFITLLDAEAMAAANKPLRMGPSPSAGNRQEGSPGIGEMVGDQITFKDVPKPKGSE